MRRSTSRSSWSVFPQGRSLTHTPQPTLLPCVEQVSSVSVVSAADFALQGFSPTSLRRRGRRRFHVFDHRLATFIHMYMLNPGSPFNALIEDVWPEPVHKLPGGSMRDGPRLVRRLRNTTPPPALRILFRLSPCPCA